MNTGRRRPTTRRRSASKSSSKPVSFSGYSLLDATLDSVRQAGSREEAMASLAKATVLLSTYMDPSSPGVRSPAVRFRSASLDETFRTQEFLDWGQPDSSTWLSELEDRLQKYFDTVKSVVDRYGPDQYQISLGFPSGVSVAFTWKVYP